MIQDNLKNENSDEINFKVEEILLKESLEKVCDGLFYLLYNWRIVKVNKGIAEHENIAQLFLQLTICKIHTLLKLSDGISIVPNNKSVKALDIPSMLSVLRSLFEFTFIFHNIYAEQDSDIERDIIMNIWKIRGLKNRQNLSSVPLQYKEQETKELLIIKEIQDETLRLINKLNIEERIREQIENVIMKNSCEIKGYKFKKETDSSKIIKFEDIRYNNRVEDLLNTSAPSYKLFCMHGHPSYLSVIQFGQMYNSNSDKDFLKTILISVCKLAARIAIDFRDNIDGANIIFSKLEDKEKHLILYYSNSQI